MDKDEICILLEQGIVYAKHMISYFNEHHISLRNTVQHQETIQYMENYIHRCQQIINDNSTDDE
jgi:hypothetical protein